MTAKTPYNNVNFECKLAMGLIAAVKEKPCIYSKTHPHYKNQSENDFAWFKIAQTLKRSPTECVNKWYFLLQRYLYRERLESKGLQYICTVKTEAFKAMGELKPLMVERYEDLIRGPLKKSFTTKIPSKLQEALIKEIKLNSKILFNELTTNDRRQDIWAGIANNLNKTELYAELPIINWQKVWWDLKSAIREKLERKSTVLSPVDKTILFTCGIRTNNIADIIKGLKSFTEFDVFVCPTDVRRCSICNHSPPTSVYNTTQWTPDAKELLPLHCRKSSLLLACVNCNLSLSKRASLAWRACRICADDGKPLRNFLDDNIRPLIIAFRGISKLPLSQAEGLPSYICGDCIRKLTEIRDFCEKSVQAQRSLQKVHQVFFLGKSFSPPPYPGTLEPVLINEDTPIIFEDDDIQAIADVAPTTPSSSAKHVDDENNYEVVFIEPPPTALNQSQPKAKPSPQNISAFSKQQPVVSLKRLQFKTSASGSSTEMKEPPEKITKHRISVRDFASTNFIESSLSDHSNSDSPDPPETTGQNNEFAEDISDIITVCEDDEDLYF